MFEFADHNLADVDFTGNVLFEKRPCLGPDGQPIEGLFNAWITLNNPTQYNSYTTDMVKKVILAFRKASNERDVVAAVFTGAGDKAFCTGGNTKEYAEYYAGRPDEYRQYMRLFNDMVSAILMCDKPVICRANGMRIGGGQEIGMACDFTIASDLANFGQAGPKHGSAPDGGSTDFLPLFVGIEQAMYSCTICDPWTAYEALRFNLISEAVPVLKVENEYMPNPLVITDRWLNEEGQLVYGKKKSGKDLENGKMLLKQNIVDLTPLDERVDQLCTKLMMTMPSCLIKTIESLRKHKLVHWDKNKESNRAWLGLNMMTEGRAGFRAFNEGVGGLREPDFIKVRRDMANGQRWTEEWTETLMPAARQSQ